MRRLGAILVVLLLSTGEVALAESPRLFFDRSEIGALRERVKQPELAPVWAAILASAEGYCDPASRNYTDPANPYVLPGKDDRVSQGRYDALLVHSVGRMLTQRMEAIGFAYQLTGRRELERHGAAILRATVRQYPVTDPLVAKGFAGGRGDIMRGLAVGYDMLSDGMDADERRIVSAACADYIDAFIKEANDPSVWWYKVHNYNGVNGGAAGCLAVALSDAYPDRVDDWTNACLKIVDRWLSAGFDEEGAYLEGVGYSGYGLSNTAMFADALRRTGRGNLLDNPTFGKLADYYALSLLPGEKVYDARNDSSYRGLGVSLLKLAESKRGGLYKWLWEQSGSDNTFLRIVWDNDVAAVDPAAAGVPTAEHFRGRGLCIWRTGWTADDVMFSVEAGPFYPVTHNQADKGHFTLYGLGHRWATDPGYANEHNPRGRGQTLGHSCVLIDGLGQAVSGAGLGTNGTIEDYQNSDRYGYALADCTEAYNQNSRGKPGAVVEHARRHCVFVYPRNGAPAYTIVLDDIRKDDKPHEFTWQMMVANSMTATLGDGSAVFVPSQASGGAYVDTPIVQDSGNSRANRSGKCTLKFNVRNAGRYVVWGRVRTQAENSGEADSFFVRMDDAPRVAWHMPPAREWAWGLVGSGAERADVRFDLEAGEHQLVVETREPGAQVDCLVLAPEGQPTPSLFKMQDGLLLLEAESGQLVAPMRIVPSAPAEARLVVQIHADADLALSTDIFCPEDDRAPAAFPRFKAATRAVNPRFVAVLLPLPTDVKPPEVVFDAAAGKRIVQIRWPSHIDSFEWPEDGEAVRLIEP